MAFRLLERRLYGYYKCEDKIQPYYLEYTDLEKMAEIFLQENPNVSPSQVQTELIRIEDRSNGCCSVVHLHDMQKVLQSVLDYLRK